MRFEDFYIKENEKPLDNLVSDGGFCGIFRKIACVGDSLSSGTMELTDENGNRVCHNLYDYSWGQYMARTTGAKVYNFSVGGLTAKGYFEIYADEKGFWDKDKLCQAYILAFGVNDLLNEGQKMGNISDVDFEDYNNNNKTFAGFYAKIIQKYKELNPDAVFFLVTMPKGMIAPDKEDLKKEHASLLYDMADVFKNTYVIDFNKYAPVYDEDFQKKFALGGHLNPMGYMLTAKMIMSYIDYIIRSDMEAFKKTAFIGMDNL